MNKKTYILSALAAILLVGMAAGVAGWQALLRPNFHCAPDTYLYIDADDTPDSVRLKIQQAGQPDVMWGFDLLTSYTKYSVRTGRYALQAGDSMWALFRRLRNGVQTPLRLTLPSVRTLDRLAGHLAHRLMLDSAQVATAFADSTFCRAYGYDTATLAALFIPNTYEVYWNLSLDKFMARMQQEHARFWNDERRRRADAIGLTPVEVATLASIIDEETAVNAEKPMVAGMYLNRLRIGMPLQADPTVKFALRDFRLRRIYHAHLEVPSPYNTYLHKGLPPGPIRIASLAGLEAVLHAVEHNYLYMCAKEDFSGTHNFAANYSQHLANARRYARALNRRGIR